MRHKIEKICAPLKKKNSKQSTNDLFDMCIKKGLIEKTEYGYYFKPEFFETLDIYDDE